MKIRTNNNERGFSLAEALVTLVLLTVIILMLYELMIGSMKASMFVESRNDLEIFAQRTVNAIQLATIESRIIHQDDTFGDDYWDLIVASDLDWAILPFSRLPVADTDSAALLDPDDPLVPETFVGNSMLLVRALEPVPILYDHDDDMGAATDEIPFFVDRYRLEFYFLSENASRSFNGQGKFLDFIKAVGPDFSDYFQLNTIFPGLSANQVTQIAQGLWDLPLGLTTAESIRMEVDGPINQAWDPTQMVNAAFYDMDNTGVFTLDPSFSTVDLKKESLLPEFGGGRISGKMEYSVATNSDTPIGNNRYGPLGIMDKVPLFGIKDTSFPAGFEVKIIGPTGARTVWSRIILCSENLRIHGPGRELESQESVVITSAREY